MRQLILLAALIGCMGASEPTTRPTWTDGGPIKIEVGTLTIAPTPVVLRYFGDAMPGSTEPLKILANAVKKNQGMNTEHYVIPLMGGAVTVRVSK